MVEKKDLGDRYEDIMHWIPKAEYISDYNPKGYNEIKAFLLEGPLYHGKQTRFFAYAGYPAESGKSAKVPAVVLVHGGGGFAFPQWVKKWNEKGYAAVAFCNTGYRPIRAEIPDFFSADNWTKESLDKSWNLGPDNDGMKNSDGPLQEQWMYHAIAQTLIADSFLRQDPRIDKNKIGLVGISWGGVIASLAIGYDPRFAFAVPVYGCGFLNESLGWMKKHFSGRTTKYLWEAGDRLKDVKIPVLWLCWANDPCFSIQCNSKSFLMTANGQLSIQKDMSHGHVEGWTPPEIYRFADAVVFGKPSLTRCVTQPDGKKGNAMAFHIQPSQDAEGITAKIWYITERMSYSQNGVLKWGNDDTIDQVWKEAGCKIKGNTVSFVLPEEADSYYVEITTICHGQAYLTSSSFITL